MYQCLCMLRGWGPCLPEREGERERYRVRGGRDREVCVCVCVIYVGVVRVSIYALPCK